MERFASLTAWTARPGPDFTCAASWSDGSQAFLDSRGLLHLKSANRNVPEITLVLHNDGALAAWSSDGRVYGPRCFHGSDTSYDPRHLDELLHRFTEHLR